MHDLSNFAIHTPHIAIKYKKSFRSKIITHPGIGHTGVTESSQQQHHEPEAQAHMAYNLT